MDIGSHVFYVDERGIQHHALVTANWNITEADPNGSLNLVYVSDNEAETDQYGRQIKREATSVVHETKQSAHGRYWFRENEQGKAFSEAFKS